MEDNIVEINSLQEFLDLAKEEEMNTEEKVLREYIRKKITKVIREQEQKEYELRKIIRSLLKEGDKYIIFIIIGEKITDFTHFAQKFLLVVFFQFKIYDFLDVSLSYEIDNLSQLDNNVSM